MNFPLNSTSVNAHGISISMIFFTQNENKHIHKRLMYVNTYTICLFNCLIGRYAMNRFLRFVICTKRARSHLVFFIRQFTVFTISLFDDVHSTSISISISKTSNLVREIGSSYWFGKKNGKRNMRKNGKKSEKSMRKENAFEKYSSGRLLTFEVLTYCLFEPKSFNENKWKVKQKLKPNLSPKNQSDKRCMWMSRCREAMLWFGNNCAQLCIE